MTNLLCLDKTTGKFLWLRSNTPYDAMTDAQRKSRTPESGEVEPLVAAPQRPERRGGRCHQRGVSATGLSSGGQAELDKTLKAKAEAERAVHDAFAKIDRRKYPQMYRNEVLQQRRAALRRQARLLGLRRRDEGPLLARHRLFRARRQTGVELARRRDPRIDRTRQSYFPESRRRSIDLRGQRDAHRPGRQDRQGVVAELPRRLAEHGSWQQFAAGGQARRGRRDRPDQIHPPRQKTAR